MNKKGSGFSLGIVPPLTCEFQGGSGFFLGTVPPLTTMMMMTLAVFGLVLTGKKGLLQLNMLYQVLGTYWL